MTTPTSKTKGREEDEQRDYFLQQVESSDLISYGMIPEFIGRLPIVVSLSSLSEEMLVNILTQPQNALVSQYTALFNMDGVSDMYVFVCVPPPPSPPLPPPSLSLSLSLSLSQVKLHFTKQALLTIAKQAISKRTGARGLRAIMVYSD